MWPMYNVKMISAKWLTVDVQMDGGKYQWMTTADHLYMVDVILLAFVLLWLYSYQYIRLPALLACGWEKKLFKG